MALSSMWYVQMDIKDIYLNYENLGENIHDIHVSTIFYDLFKERLDNQQTLNPSAYMFMYNNWDYVHLYWKRNEISSAL